MIHPLVNGYLVVSQRETGTIYQGPDRSPWDLIDDHFYKRTLPEHIRIAYENIVSDPTNGYWWPTCTDREIAITLASYSRDAGALVDLIAIYSPYLAGFRGRAGWQEPRARLLGVDVVGVGEWSLLSILVEARDPECRSAVASVNDAGLLPNASGAGTIEARYRELSKVKIVESLAEPNPKFPVEAVYVYSLDDGLGNG